MGVVHGPIYKSEQAFYCIAPSMDRDGVFVLLEEEADKTNEDGSCSVSSSRSELLSSRLSSEASCGMPSLPPSSRLPPGLPCAAAATRHTNCEENTGRGIRLNGEHEECIDPVMEAQFSATIYRDAFAVHIGAYIAIMMFRLGWMLDAALSEDALEHSAPLLFGPAPRTSTNSVFIPGLVLVITSRYLLHQMDNLDDSWHIGSRAWVALCLINGLYSTTVAYVYHERLSTQEERLAGPMSIAVAGITACLLGILNGSHGLDFLERQLVFGFFIATGAIYMVYCGAATMSPFFGCVAAWVIGETMSLFAVERIRKRRSLAMRAGGRLPTAAPLPSPQNARYVQLVAKTANEPPVLGRAKREASAACFASSKEDSCSC